MDDMDLEGFMRTLITPDRSALGAALVTVPMSILGSNNLSLEVVSEKLNRLRLVAPPAFA